MKKILFVHLTLFHFFNKKYFQIFLIKKKLTERDKIQIQKTIAFSIENVQYICENFSDLQACLLSKAA